MNDGRRPLTFRLMHAVAASDLPAHLRHFSLTLALLADAETGRGYYSQGAIAKAMGCSDRQVRSNFRELESRTDSPVRVERRRRGTADGKGRSSDEWQIVLTPDGLNRKPTSGSDSEHETAPTGSPLPLEPTSTGSPLPVTGDLFEGLNRKSATAQPEVCDSSTGSPLPGIGSVIGSSIGSNKDARERAVFEAWSSKVWRKVHKRGEPRRTEKRMKPIRARLRDGFTVEQLVAVFEKAALSDYHLAGGYIEPETLLRNREKVEWWLVRDPARRVTVQRGVVDEAEAESWGRAGAEALLGSESS